MDENCTNSIALSIIDDMCNCFQCSTTCEFNPKIAIAAIVPANKESSNAGLTEIIALVARFPPQSIMLRFCCVFRAVACIVSSLFVWWKVEWKNNGVKESGTFLENGVEKEGLCWLVGVCGEKVQHIRSDIYVVNTWLPLSRVYWSCLEADGRNQK